MHPKRFALIGGLLMVALGVISLIPQFVGSMEGLPALRLQESYGLFLGLFPMNILNKILLIVLGAAGVYASSERFTDLPSSITFARGVFVTTAVLALLGLIPQTNTLFGYAPLFGNSIGLHIAFAVIGAYFGFALTARVPHKDFKSPAHGL